MIHIGTIPHGDGHKPPFWAEIGTLFGQDVNEAAKMIGAIAKARDESGWPVILKGEILDDPSICLDLDDYGDTYFERDGTEHWEKYRDLIDRKVVPLDDYRVIAGLAYRYKLPIVMSVYTNHGADFARRDLGVAALKIASSNVTHYPLIRHCGGLGVPLVIDTGRATIREMDKAVTAARASGAEVILGHSPTGNPALPAQHNLGMIAMMRDLFDCPVGLSDHCMDHTALIAAVAAGADYVERNLAPDPDDVDQECSHATDYRDVGTIIKAMSDAWEMTAGAPWRPNLASEMSCNSARMGLVAAVDIPMGKPVCEPRITYAFPDSDHHDRGGIPVARANEANTAARDIKAGEPIRWEDVT